MGVPRWSESRSRRDGTAIIVPYDRYTLGAELPNITEVVKLDPKGDAVPCDPPSIVVNALIRFPDRLDLPVLNQVITTPVFSPDSTLITEKGYPPKAQLWYEPLEGMHLMLPVKREPTDEDIAVAKEWIIGEHGMFGQMLWAGPRDCAHAVTFVP